MNYRNSFASINSTESKLKSRYLEINLEEEKRLNSLRQKINSKKHSKTDSSESSVPKVTDSRLSSENDVLNNSQDSDDFNFSYQAYRNETYIDLNEDSKLFYY